jgi:hypothetical protein
MDGEFPGETLGHAGSSARGAAGKGYSRKAKVQSRWDTPSLFREMQTYNPVRELFNRFAHEKLNREKFRYRGLHFYVKYGLLKVDKST